ncbi:thioredoxin fold domain-containing protein [Marinobacter salinisoli]|uniref:Thiol:disulfide interchange protein n=1 Tax=Marinobacter salinisoli TaxID=2769486 RepID=A0ABX7MXY4_9GAMM|nr:thioredoxin fold domain-containing protein [Marinobacter salinisoli]QSP96290.1 thioredoxin fold domain-containing protein [Marinobacter salinisoli]
MNVRRVIAVLGLVAGFGAPAVAGEVEDLIAERLAAAVPGLQIESVTESEAKGLYTVETRSGETIYSTADGKHVLSGDLLRLTDAGVANVTEEARANRRNRLMAEFGDKGVIQFPAEGEEKAVIDVFTDIDCPYCRKLHDEVPELNAYGITVNYYGFPRSGPGTPSFNKYVSVWCADDQQAAMDAAKGGRSVTASTCDNPVLEQFQLGGRVGVTGTPAILLEDGNMVRGYVPASNLAKGLGLL